MLKYRINIMNKLSVFFDVITIAGTFTFTYYFRVLLKNYLYRFDMFPGMTVMGYLQPISRYLGLLWFVIPTWILILYFFGVYDFTRSKGFLRILIGVTKSLVVGTLVFFLYIIIFKIDYIGRSFILLFPPTCLAFLLLNKITLIKLMRVFPYIIHNCNNILLVGTGARAQRFCNIIERHADWGLKISGFIDVEPELVGTRVNGYEVKGILKDIENIIKNEVIDEVVFVLPRRYLVDLEKVFIICEREGINVSLAGDLFNTKNTTMHISTFEDFPLIQYETVSTNVWGLFIKRVIDIVVSSILLVLLSFPFLIIAILIKVSSKGTVFFNQVRCTKNGRKFNLYKFRTMVQDAEGMRESLANMNEATGPVFKIEKDPRLVKSTSFMRKFSIDELPQLYNVLRGDLGLVGPRPLPLIDEKYDEGQRRRLSMRSGLTCLWQVRGRNSIPFKEWMELDLEYIDHWSLWLDFIILLKTIPVVLFGKGK